MGIGHWAIGAIGAIGWGNRAGQSGGAIGCLTLTLTLALTLTLTLTLRRQLGTGTISGAALPLGLILP